MRKILITLTAAVLLIAAAPSAGWADEWGDVDCAATSSNPRCTVNVSYTGAGNSHKVGGGTVSCTIGSQPAECHNEFGWLGSDSCYYGKDPGGYLPANQWIKTCINPATDETTDWGVVTLYQPPAALGALTQRAVDSLEIPTPAIAANPAFAATQVVWVPIWWWAQPGSWQTRAASASAGGLTITAQATPRKMTWQAGDGTPATVCDGPGTPWKASADPKAASPDCGHIYTVPSEPNKYTIHATATWDITWSGGGFSGTEPAVTATTTATVTVAQRRAVVSG
jgi:hypothetical protein